MSAPGVTTARSRVGIGGKTASLVRSMGKGKRPWIIPLMAALLLGTFAVYGQRDMHASLGRTVADRLEAVLDANTHALRRWLDQSERSARALARAPVVQQAAVELLEMAREGAPADALADAEALARLRDVVERYGEALGYDSFYVVDREGLNLAVARGCERELLRRTLAAPAALELLERVRGGDALVSRPFLIGKPPRSVMLAAAPLRHGGKVIGALALQLDGDELSRVLAAARLGESGETFAFDRNGVMLSNSRFNDALMEMGLLRQGERAALRIAVRDPGVNLAAGAAVPEDLASRPLTRMAQAATRGQDGTDAEGYRDYRGVRVIGAWHWFERYGFGIATEIDHDEAYRLVDERGRMIGLLLTALIFSALGMVGVAWFMTRVQEQMRAARAQLSQMGQYELERKLGAGGMGTVYLAQHRLLQRPTALKVLQARGDEHALARFEREVRQTASLEHPNTIQIFDFGATDDGDFYYAMEYLEGVDLEELVAESGPQPPGRVVYLLSQACNSLREAHQTGLVHRDIKPANIFLTCRGGESDVVKVLDFGLVKNLDDPEQTLSNALSITGTPGYIAPEAISGLAIDSRADLFALGAVGYFLLCGKPPFEGRRVAELLEKTLTYQATPFSRHGVDVPEDLGALIMASLAKDPAERPGSAQELRDELLACSCARDWTEARADGWWRARRAAGEPGEATETGGELGD